MREKAMYLHCTLNFSPDKKVWKKKMLHQGRKHRVLWELDPTELVHSTQLSQASPASFCLCFQTVWQFCIHQLCIHQRVRAGENMHFGVSKCKWDFNVASGCFLCSSWWEGTELGFILLLECEIIKVHLCAWHLCERQG